MQRVYSVQRRRALIPLLPYLLRPSAAQSASGLRTPLRCDMDFTQFLKRVPVPRLPRNGSLRPPFKFFTIATRDRRNQSCVWWTAFAYQSADIAHWNAIRLAFQTDNLFALCTTPRIRGAHLGVASRATVLAKLFDAKSTMVLVRVQFAFSLARCAHLLQTHQPVTQSTIAPSTFARVTVHSFSN